MMPLAPHLPTGWALLESASVFNITGGEVIIIAIVALVILGPDKLPDFIRRAGRVYGEVKKISQGFKTEFRDVIEEPVREMQDTVNLAKSWFEEGKTAVGTMDDSGWGTPDVPDSDTDAARQPPPVNSGPADDAVSGAHPAILDPFKPVEEGATPGFDDSHVVSDDGESLAGDYVEDDDNDTEEDDDPNFYDADGKLVMPSDVEPRTDSFGQLSDRPSGEANPS